MTILFADVDGFTTIAEQLSSQELSEQTSQYFETVTSAVAEESGTIDKFIGVLRDGLVGSAGCHGGPRIPCLCGGPEGQPPNGAAQCELGSRRPQADASADRRPL